MRDEETSRSKGGGNKENMRDERYKTLYIFSEGWSFHTLIGSMLERHIDLLFTCHLSANYLLFKKKRGGEAKYEVGKQAI